MMEKQRTAKREWSGFTIIELLIALAIGTLLISFSVLALRNFDKQKTLDSEAMKVVAILRAAQEKSFSQEGGRRWGVYFVNNASPAFDYYSLFEVDEALVGGDPSIIPATQILEQNKLPSSLDFQSPAEGGANNIAIIRH